MISLNENLGGGPEQEPAPKPDTVQKHSIKPFDTANHFGVAGPVSGGITLLMPPKAAQVLSREQALNLAAWLVVLADLGKPAAKTMEEFGRLVAEIQST